VIENQLIIHAVEHATLSLSVHVEAATRLASEAIVGALVMGLVGDHGHVLFVDGEASYVRS